MQIKRVNHVFVFHFPVTVADFSADPGRYLLQILSLDNSKTVDSSNQINLKDHSLEDLKLF
jgi:hypothetical protein